VRNLSDDAASTLAYRIVVNGARISGTDDSRPRGDGFSSIRDSRAIIRLVRGTSAMALLTFGAHGWDL
jgi:hypothetical protein